MNDVALAMNPILIGIAGPGGAGKDTVGSILEEFNFAHISASDMLRAEMKASGVDKSSQDRRGQNHFANACRAKHGGHYFVKTAFEAALAAAHENNSLQRPQLGVSGIYTVTEVHYFLKHLAGTLIYVDASPDLRFARLTHRADGRRDHMSRTDFEKAEVRESTGVSDNDANLTRVREFAAYEICNDGTLDDLRHQVEAMINSKLARKATRIGHR